MSVISDLQESIQYVLSKHLDATQAAKLADLVIKEIQSQFGGQQIYITFHFEKINERDENIRAAYRKAIAQIQNEYKISYQKLHCTVRGRGAKADSKDRDLFNK